MMNIMSCVVSYVLISFVAFIRLKFDFLSKIPDNAIYNSGISLLIGTLFAILIALIFSSKWFSNITVKLFHKTSNEDIWRDILDLQNGSNLKIYLKKCLLLNGNVQKEILFLQILLKLIMDLEYFIKQKMDLLKSK